MIQYAAAIMVDHDLPGILDRPVKPGDDSFGLGDDRFGVGRDGWVLTAIVGDTRHD
jgi:hypothetical protein